MRGRPRKPCPWCGVIAYGDDRTKRGFHIQCAINSHAEAVDQIRNKSGPVYEKLVRNAQIARAKYIEERQAKK